VYVTLNALVQMVPSLAQAVSRWCSGPKCTITRDSSAVSHRPPTLRSLWWLNRTWYSSRRSRSSLLKQRYHLCWFF